MQRRREAVGMLTGRLDLSERRASTITPQRRSMQRYEARIDAEEQGLRARMHDLVRGHPRYGYRRIVALLRGEGFRANDKRVNGLWRQEGFKVRQKSMRKRRLGDSSGDVTRHSAKAPNEVWAWDVIHDRLADGRPVKGLSCIDKSTPECLLPEPRRSIKAKDAAFAATQRLPKTSGREVRQAPKQAPPLRSIAGKDQNRETLRASGR